MNFPISEALNGQVKIITAPRRLEGDISAEFRKKIIDLVQDGSLKLIVDLSATQFMDSEGISAIVARISIARSGGGDVRVICTSEFIKNLLHITHLDKLLKNFESMESAVDSFKE